jgi:hypothetical protein
MNKRHFPTGHSSRPPKETYRIDHTSVDGSGLQRDDGAQFHEELPPDADDKAYSPRRGKY